MSEEKQREKQKAYEKYVKKITPVHNLPLNMLKAFLTGGLICVLGQLILNTASSIGADKETAGNWCSLLLIFISVILTGLNVYSKIGKFGGAGRVGPYYRFRQFCCRIGYRIPCRRSGLRNRLQDFHDCRPRHPVWHFKFLASWPYLLCIQTPGGDLMNSGTLLGKASISFSRPVYIQSCASVVGPKEGDGPLKNCFDMICDDPMFGEKKWEAAESAMQKEAAVLAIGKAGLTPDDIRFVFAGDLLAQTIASSFGIAEMGIPFFGLYGACSTMGESLSLGAIAVSAGYGHHILCATSSHFATAEKEFRFPLGYGCQRPLSATWTVTGSAACILSPEAPHPSEIVGSSLLRSTLGSVAITGITTGKVIDFGFRDSLNMGGCMAPAACDTIYRHFEDFGRSVNDYDAVLTGDLGVVGRQILLDLLKEKNIDLSSVHQDCGLLIYDNQKQDTHSGGSGCGCAASVLAAYILPRVVSGFWKRVLFVPTGAMLSKVSFNEGESVAGIAHGVVIEHISKETEV